MTSPLEQLSDTFSLGQKQNPNPINTPQKPPGTVAKPLPRIAVQEPRTCCSPESLQPRWTVPCPCPGCSSWASSQLRSREPGLHQHSAHSRARGAAAHPARDTWQEPELPRTPHAAARAGGLLTGRAPTSSLLPRPCLRHTADDKSARRAAVRAPQEALHARPRLLGSAFC